MADHYLRFYDADPYFILSRTNGGTATWSGTDVAEGKALVTDNQAGADGLTLDETAAGGETATADIDINGTTSTGVSVYASESWTLRDTVTGEIFQVVTLRVTSGGATGYYTLSEIPLVAGRTYETQVFDATPNAGAGDPAFTYSDYVAAHTHLVSGTNGDDTINGSYSGDPENDQVDDGFAAGPNGNANTIEAGDGNDIVNAGLGDDTIDGGAGSDTIDAGVGDDSVLGGTGADSIDGGDGADTILGGAGADTIFGGAGDDSIDGEADADLIHGGDGNDTIAGGDGDDTIFGGDGTAPTSSTEFLDWSLQGGDGTNVAGGFTQVTGDMEVSLTFTDDGNNNPTFLIETSDTGYTETGEDFDPNSMLRLYGNGDADTSTTRIDFAAGSGSGMLDEVQNVSFRINDIDAYAGNHTDTVTINAYDANNQPVTVTITPEGDDTVAGNTITAGNALDDPQDANGSALVEIAGPLSYIEIIYSNGQTLTHAVMVSDIYFETIPDPGYSGDDVIDGGAGDDVIDAEGGNDTITGGTGNDTITGGPGDDVFVLEDGFGADTVTDFDTGDTDGDGFYNDQLDVTNLTDADGNPVNAWDVVVTDDGSGNALLTFPNGETLLLQGVSPAEVTGAQLLNAAGVPCFTKGTLIRTAGGEVPVEDLRVGDKVLTMDQGEQRIDWIGRRDLGPADLAANPQHKPIHIPEGVCGNFAPLQVSPQHGMLVSLPGFGAGEVLVRAKHLAELCGPVRVAQGKRQVSYIHLMFARHQIVFANGAASESFYPGKYSLEMFPARVLASLFAVFPKLRNQPAEQAYGPPARPYLKRREVMKSIWMQRQAGATAIAA
ncbi:MAG: Hint domain-containing protein [Rhodobacter sp.]|nr:Hint domain-containing protein [Rhodobacter sp.]